MSKNMDYIIYINSLVDHVKYKSYSDVQAAIARGEILPDPPEYRPKHVCKFCGKEIVKINPWDSSEFCNMSCNGKWIYREKHKNKPVKGQRTTYLRVRTGPQTNRYQERVISIVPYYNEGFSDMQIGKLLGLSDKYIAKIRGRYAIPANYGRPPETKIDITKI